MCILCTNVTLTCPQIGSLQVVKVYNLFRKFLITANHFPFHYYVFLFNKYLRDISVVLLCDASQKNYTMTYHIWQLMQKVRWLVCGYNFERTACINVLYLRIEAVVAVTGEVSFDNEA